MEALDIETGNDVLRGDCIVLFAFDVGQSVDLARAETMVVGFERLDRLVVRGAASTEIQAVPRPLRLRRVGEQLRLGERLRLGEQPRVGEQGLEVALDVWVYDFGGLSVAYRFTHAGPLATWIELATDVLASRELVQDARARVAALLASISSAIEKPDLSATLEDYVIFRFDPPSARGAAERWCDARAADLARLLRAEAGELSGQEVADALSSRVAFGTTDLAIVDWNAAVLFDSEPEELVAVLEFANLQLCELRFLDRQLDHALDQAYESLIRRVWRGVHLPGAFDRELARVSRHQVDAAVLYERVTNALKLYNDQYLARVYRQASTRLRLAEWSANILRKLETLDGIYQKIQDRAESRRMEALEWIIIVLIAISMVLPFLPGYGH
ncbi:MAG: hypothetical protein L6Q99_19485 [Planctomycetes bacterium]|nr:hypothetical protein [Planctomycetota bacterium]